MSERTLTALDHCLDQVGRALRTACAAGSHQAARPNPARTHSADDMNERERLFSGRLMRVNHAGEVAAQALYQGQAFAARTRTARDAMRQSAAEEIDHLAWCEERLVELGASASKLDPFWYLGSFAIGAAAGLAGDKFSLGFVAETERQVVEHLQGHLKRLPEKDQRSRTLLEQMQADEAHHGDHATRAGGTSMPKPVRLMMRLTSRVMTGTAYWI